MSKIDNYVYMLTTIPSRLIKIDETLSSLTENIPIILNIPKYSIREKKDYPDATFLKEKFKNLIIVKSDIDYGPCTKLIPGLNYLNLAYPNKNIGIIMIDDDMKYDKNLLTDLKYYHEKYPDCSIGFSGDVVCSYPYIGSNLKHYNYRRIWIGDSHKVDFLHGWMGILHQSRFFDLKSISDFSEFPDYVKFVDDEWFSYLLAKKNINRIVCKFRKSNLVKELNRENGLNNNYSMNGFYQTSIINLMVKKKVIVPYGNQTIGDFLFQSIPIFLIHIFISFIINYFYFLLSK